MKLLVHFCCAPCGIAVVNTLKYEKVEFTGFWYNPNIHPYTEYRSRRDSLRLLAETKSFELIEKDEYGLRPFVRAVAGDIEGRCSYCYASRLFAAAKAAKEGGFDAFTTTLLISPYQNHEKITEAGMRAAMEYGLSFYYRDFRPMFREGQKLARESGLYMQKYCGCIFSEEERYLKKKTEGSVRL
ncbi:MAG: epoxyqueuosine reductase QueH [Oscillospiraceae bacterium]|jgi:predicted adenine nucleotide alpha hydrolase (AANH) superfamily ATPase